MPRPGGFVSFDNLCEYAIVAKPLIRPETITSKSLARSLLDFFSAPFLDKFRPYPVLIEEICTYLDPFPELTALTYAVSIARQYFKSSGYTWTDALSLKPGITLYMTFNTFQGYEYLSHMDVNQSASWTKSIKVQDQLLVCRDHFAILDFCTSVDAVRRLGLAKPLAFYQTIALRKTGVKELKLRGFSDVSINPAGYLLANVARAVS